MLNSSISSFMQHPTVSLEFRFLYKQSPSILNICLWWIIHFLFSECLIILSTRWSIIDFWMNKERFVFLDEAFFFCSLPLDFLYLRRFTRNHFALLPKFARACRHHWKKFISTFFFSLILQDIRLFGKRNYLKR